MLPSHFQKQPPPLEKAGRTIHSVSVLNVSAVPARAYGLGV